MTSQLGLPPRPPMPSFPQRTDPVVVPPHLRAWRWVRSRRPSVLWVNVGLVVLLILGALGAYLVIGDPGASASTAVRTATVARGNVTATVTGSGNAASALSTAVSFVGSGTVTAIRVRAGDVVRLGQVLATIDQTGAKQSLRTAQAALATAQAQYQQAVSGPTAVQKQKDQLAVTQAEQGVVSAQNAVTNAQRQLELDTTSLQNAIDNAHAQQDNDRTSLAAAVNNAHAAKDNDSTVTDTTVSNAQANASTACAAGATASASAPSSASATTSASSGGAGTGSCTSAQQAVVTAQQNRDTTLMKDDQAITQAEQNQNATLAKDDQAITTAEQNRTATLAKDAQAITTAKQQVITAQGQVTSAGLAAKADLTPQTPAQIAQARASVTTAQVQVAQARTALDETALKAPQAGTVLAVNGKVGQSSSAISSGTSSSSAASSSSSSSGSGSSSGFISIANVSQLAVTANIAEADAANVRLGQAATVTFPATGTTADGTVTQISPQSTTSNNVVQYPVTVSLTSAPDGVKVGATASLSITTGSVQGVLVVPSSAITTLGTRHTVTVRRNGSDSVVPVEVGLVGNSGTEVTSGVDEGDVLVLPTAAATTGTGGGFPRLGAGAGLGGGRG